MVVVVGFEGIEERYDGRSGCGGIGGEIERWGLDDFGGVSHGREEWGEREEEEEGGGRDFLFF